MDAKVPAFSEADVRSILESLAGPDGETTDELKVPVEKLQGLLRVIQHQARVVGHVPASPEPLKVTVEEFEQMEFAGLQRINNNAFRKLSDSEHVILGGVYAALAKRLVQAGLSPALLDSGLGNFLFTALKAAHGIGH